MEETTAKTAQPMDGTSDRRDPRKAVLLVASMMTIMAGATISPSLPEIDKVFKDTANVDLLVPLVLTGPALAIALTASFIGLAIDRFGRKPVLVVALFVYGIAGSSGLYLDTLAGLLVGRVALGFSVAAIMTATNTLVADYYVGKEREAFIGAQSSAVGFSGVFFLIGGGLLADVSWRAPFAIYLASYLLLPAVIFVLHEPERVVQQKGAKYPPIDPRIRMRIGAAYLLAFIMMVTFFLIPVKLPFYLIELGESSAARAGLAIAVGTLSMAIIALFYKRLRRFFSVRALFAIAFLILTAAFSTLAFAGTYTTVLVATIVNGIGFGIAMPNLNVWLAGLAPAHARGRIFGGLTTAFFLGQFVSPILAAPIIDRNGLGGPFGGFAASALVLLAFAIAFVVLTLRQPGKPA
jgi:MFS family permease